MNEYHQRLSALADAVNDTARMARVSLSLLLLLGLYLGLTLLSATDENLFRNSTVALPQLNTGISLQQSYLFAPPLFFYMHIQSLFLMRVLKRKIDSFYVALEVAFGPNKDVERKECLDWLSAFSFVQIFRNEADVSRISLLLVWLGTSAIPLVLLFLIDISFLRYQSFEITLCHHLFFFADIFVVWWFHHKVLENRFLKVTKWLTLMLDLKSISTKEVGTFVSHAVKILLSLVNRGAVITMMLFVALYAWPPKYSLDMDADGYRANALRGMIKKDLIDALLDNDNLLDVVWCPRWSWSCRRLNGESLQLTRIGKSSDITGMSKNFEEDYNRIYQMSYGIDLSGRSLRFANLENAWLPGARLLDADLSGALLRTAQLYGANMTRAIANGAYMYQAKLSRADLRQAQLMSASLAGAELNDVDFCEANLEAASLGRAKVNRANFHLATLKKANLHMSALTLANFHAAKMIGATVRIRSLECTNFHAADLTNADIQVNELRCVNFHATKLEGAKLEIDKAYCSDIRVDVSRGGTINIKKIVRSDSSCSDECDAQCPRPKRKISDCREPGYIRPE